MSLRFNCFFITVFVATQIFSQAPVRDINYGFQDIASQVEKSLKLYKKQNIAIFDFYNLDGDVTNLGKIIAEELITKLFRTHQFKVMERLRLHKLLSDNGINFITVIEPKLAIKIGSLLDVDVIITGSIANFNESVKVNVRLFSTKDGSFLDVASSEIIKDKTIRLLLNEISLSDFSPVNESSVTNSYNAETSINDQFDDNIISNIWNEKWGDWFIVDGMLAQNDRNIFSMITCGSFDRLGYEMQLRVKKIDGRDGFLIGVKLKKNGEALVWNIGANNNKISVLQKYLNLISIGGNTVKYMNIPGTEKKFYVENDEWYNLRVVIRGPNLRCYINEKIMIDLNDPLIQVFNQGQIFLGTYMTRAYIDDVIILGIEN